MSTKSKVQLHATATTTGFTLPLSKSNEVGIYQAVTEQFLMHALHHNIDTWNIQISKDEETEGVLGMTITPLVDDAWQFGACLWLESGVMDCRLEMRGDYVFEELN